MKNTRLFLLILSLSFFAFVGCSTTKEQQPNDKPHQERQTIKTNIVSGPQDMAQQQPSKSSSLALKIQGPQTYIDDQGVITHALGEGDFLTQFLDTQDNTPTLDVKQATLSIQGASMIRKNMASIKEHLLPIRASIETKGNDLFITPDFTNVTTDPSSNHASSYILFRDTLPTSYRIEAASNRYTSALFVIPQNQRTLLALERSSDYENIILSHNNSELSYESLAYRNTLSQSLSIVNNKTIDIALENPRHSGEKEPVDIFHLTFSEGRTGNENCLNTVDTKSANLFHLNQHLQDNNLKIDSCKKIKTKEREDGLIGTITTANNYHQAILTMQGGTIQIAPLTHDTFDPTISAIYPSGDDWGPLYQIKIETPFALHWDDIEAQCLSIRSGCEVNKWDKALSIQPIPGVQYDEEFSLTNIFGQTAKTSVSYRIDSIDPRATIQQMVSNESINILPSNGDFSDVLIEYRNVEQFTLSLQACTVGEKFITNQGYIGKAVENYFFDCQGKKEEIVVKPILGIDEPFQYRKTYRTAINLPESFQSNASFKLFFTDKKGNKQSHFVTLSDIAIWTKKSEDTISLRSMYYQDGEPINGTYSATTVGGQQLDKGTIVNGKATVTLPPESINYDERNKRLILLTIEDSDGNTAWTAIDRLGNDYISINNTPLGAYRSLKIESNLSPSDIVPSDSNMSFWGEIPPWSIYGYAARGMYKPGDTIEVAGFVRNMSPLKNNGFANASIVATLYPPTQSMESKKITLSVDEFGGFQGSFTIPEDAPLGSYDVEYNIEEYSYSHNIAVEEYTKPTFSMEGSIEQQPNLTSLSVTPRYFFGTGLSTYDLQVDWSVAEKETCYYCRWSESPDTYTNTILGSMETLYGETTHTNQSYSSTVELLQQDELDDILPGTQLKVTATVKDNITNEVQHRTWYEDIGGDALITLEGRTRDRIYRDGSMEDPRTSSSLHGSLEEKSTNIDSLIYEVYYRSYQRGTQKGVDGNVYYVSDSPYQKILTKKLSPKDGDFEIPVEFLDEPGSYVISVKGYQDEKLIVQNDKMIYRYYRKNTNDLLGPIPNNYTLTVVPDQENYQVNDQVSLDIMPYPRGAKAVVTVEQGQYILDSHEITLDGDPITLPLYTHYTPQVSISVMALQPTSLSTGARQEPRFFAGYAQVGVSTEHKELTIKLTTDQSVYLPGEEVSITIETTDHLGQPVDARVSLAVVDKALTYLYERNKDPLSHFFRKIGTSVATYTNMKLLYQSLKVFATDGSKGGGGVGGETMFAYIRDELLDQAYRNPSVKTKNGSAKVSFTLPDNMTTWLIDAVGITKDTKLGTTSHEFRTQQDVIVEGYMPRFMTLGDSIEVPYKIILADTSTDNTIAGRIWITNANDTATHEIITYKETATKSKTARISIPDAWRETPYINVHHEVQYGNSSDHIVQTIPLRTEGLIYRQGESVISTKGQTTLTLPAYRTANMKVQGSTLPTQIILPSIHATLYDSSFYHSTPAIEQLQALIHLKQREEVSSSYPTRFQNNEVYIEDHRYNIDDRIASLVNIISNYQKDGGAIVPHTRRYGIDSDSTYHNSYLAYQALLSLQDSSYISENQKDKVYSMTERISEYLENYRNISLELRNLIQVTKAQHNLPTNNTDRLIVEQSGYKGILDYLRATHEPTIETTKLMRELAVVPTNRDTRAYGHADVSLSTALLIQAMMKDNLNSISEVTPQLQSLFALSNKNNGCQSCAPLVQSRVRQTIIDSRSYLQPVSQTTCIITSSKGSETVRVTEDNSFQLDVTLTGSEALLTRSCEDPLVWDVVAHYMPTTISAANDRQSDSVTHMEQEFILEDNMANIVTSFATTLAGENAVVAVHLPSTMTHVAKDLLSQEILFSDYHCRPDHMEQRYDKLIMYYDILEPGTCDFSFPAMATFAGEVMVMPLQIYEANKGLVRGTKAIGG